MKLFLALLAASALAGCALHVHVHEAPHETTAAPAHELAGRWTVRGQDAVSWSAQLVLDPASQEGFFEWRGSDGATGREHVVWQFEPRSRLLALKGIEMHEPRGNIGVGTYVASVTENGQRIVDGTWGPPATPGTWQASR